MIDTKEKLNRTLKIEQEQYFKGGKLGQIIVCSKNFMIAKFQKYLRYEEYYGNTTNKFGHKILYYYYKRKKNKIGQKLGFDIPANCFDEGLHIYHVGPITINSKARIGKNCIIYGNICIGLGGSGVPVIGDNCILGYGSVIIGDVIIGDGSKIGAGAVVIKSFEQKNNILAGIPAKLLNTN